MSTVSDRLGEQAKQVKNDFRELGETAVDAAQEKFEQAGEKAAECYEQGRRPGPRCRLRLRAIHRQAAAEVGLDGGRRRVVARSLLETPLTRVNRMAPSDQFAKSAWSVGVDRRGRRGPLPGQGCAGSLDARRAAELPAQPGVRLA